MMNVFSDINFKDEFWKFTPKALLKDDFIRGSKSFLESSIYLGPNEETLSEQSWEVLKEQGFIEIISSNKEIELYKEKFEVKKANLNYIFDNQVKAEKSLEIKFIKNLPSPVWCILESFSEPVKFSFSKGIKTQIVFIEKEDDGSRRLFPLDFVASEDTEADIYFNFRSSGASVLLSNITAELNSKIRVFNFCGGKSDYKRLEVRSYQTAKNSEVTLNGLSLIKDKAVVDYHSDSFHLNLNQRTFQTYKTISSGSSKNIFGGRVHLSKNSEGAEVEQLNKNILLSKKASVDTQPELNIDQDDVKATHGATTSSLDDDHFFYLASRGFEKEQSRRLLVDAFCKSALLQDSEKGIHNYFVDQIMEDLENV